MINEEVVTRRKHLIVVIVVSFTIFGLIISQVQRLQADDRQEDLAAAQQDAFEAQLRAYDSELVQYESCLNAIESREATRRDNERDSDVLQEIVMALDATTGESSQPVIDELFRIIENGRQLDDKERPVIPNESCPPRPVAPTPPGEDREDQ